MQTVKIVWASWSAGFVAGWAAFGNIAGGVEPVSIAYAVITQVIVIASIWAIEKSRRSVKDRAES